MQSFWGTLKTELIYSHGKYATRREAELAIQEYIEVFYNRQRIQKAAGISFPGNV
jgi:putative transposase